MRIMPPSAHPLHLHGHDFVILAQVHGPFNASAVTPLMKNPALRDTADVLLGGWLCIAFQVDNLGAWLLHYHIAFHSSEGIALQYLEQASRLRGFLDDAGVVGEFTERCNAWAEWYEFINISASITQANPGI